MFDHFHREIPTSVVENIETWPSECGGEEKRINFLEHVVLTLNLTFMPRGNLEVDLVSPQNTTATVLRKRTTDKGASTIANYSVLSLHHWGENPKGNWAVTFRNADTDRHGQGKTFS